MPGRHGVIACRHLTLVALLGACASAPLAPCADGLLATKLSRGAACLARLERASEIRAWVAANGAPDYVDTEGAIRLLYVDLDAVVSFGTSWFGARAPDVQARIRSRDHVRFSDADRARLTDHRLDRRTRPDRSTPQGGILRAKVGS